MIEYASDTLTGIMLGNYRLEGLIGDSQRGSVFLARSNAGATTYLVRFLAEPTNQGAPKHNDYREERFHSLASRVAALQHPSILPLVDYGIYEGTPYLVSPNTVIRSLRRRLSNNGPMHAFIAGRYLDQIAATLDYAHEQGVLHGNLTLDCIFVRLDGRLVVADFGVQSLLELNASGKLSSRRSEACAPEQLLGRPTGPSTDVYALGAVLYQLLTGSSVFAGPTTFEVAQQHLFATVPPLSQRRSDLPAGLDSIIAQALAKDPQQRYQQAGALANAYHEVVDPHDRKRVPFVLISSPAAQVRQSFVPGAIQAEGEFTEHEWSTNGSGIDHPNGLGYQGPETPVPPTLEDDEDSPTLKRIPALLKQTPMPFTVEDVADSPTLKSVPVLLKQTPVPPTLEDVSEADPSDLPSNLATWAVVPAEMTVSEVDSPDLPSNPQNGSLHGFQQKHTRRRAVISLLLVLIASGTVGVLLIFRQNNALAGLIGQVQSFGSTKILLGLCIILAIAFTVGFNIISRISLSTTKHEYAYTILWQLCCALLVPFFLPFDRFSINVSPHMLLLLALSVVLWALVDAFLFSAFKYEEASILSGIFPLNFVFTFVVSTVFFHSMINPTIVIGFLIIMAASLLIGVYHTRLRPSKGIVFGLLYSFFLGVALGFNSEVVKSFSIPPYMFAAFLFPAVANLLIFLRPKGAELRYELKVQWKKILLNAAVMDASFFFLLKAFQLGNVPQVVALSASSTLLTVLAGVVVLKEDKHIALKILAAGLATLGVVLIQW